MHVCLSLVPRPHCCTCGENVSGQLPSVFTHVHQNAEVLFSSNLMLDIIEDYIPLCVPTIF